ncbi:YraN family protein [Desulfopila sp. IMCC35006]|uniref:YraN family protein n=1 Tax=Desulfopila sp. IMCC35006 TaxID=2569542 RepID=UPI0010AD77CA|nr:YraN family protein [Desulfopila sp. IMCC35006]TKB28161.1 YraN family protein [Desulfopila sp. IMCC35006]
MLNRRQRLGKSGEETVAQYLKNMGYTIVVVNYRCKVGEIDIIARDDSVLVFIEVKTRSGLDYGFPAEAVTPRKQRQISRAAQWYLTEKQLLDVPARFDVITVLGLDPANYQIEHINNAFDLCE